MDERGDRRRIETRTGKHKEYWEIKIGIPYNDAQKKNMLGKCNDILHFYFNQQFIAE